MKEILKKIHQQSMNNKNSKSLKTEVVAGTDIENLYFDLDFGFFSAILACYNNHWVLRTSPDDWWNCIVRNVSQIIDENGDKNKVKDFFVAHEDKKLIEVNIGPTLGAIKYDCLFDQFSKVQFPIIISRWR